MARLNPEAFPILSDMAHRSLQNCRLEFDCKAASAFLMLALHRIGYPDAYRLTVGVDAFNPAYMRWVSLNGLPTDEDDKARCEVAGGIQARLGKGTEGLVGEDCWPGHLTVVAPNARSDSNHAVFDLTIGQMNLRVNGVNVPPLLLAVGTDFLDGRDTFSTTANGTHLRYTAYPDDQSFNEPEDYSLCHDTISMAEYFVDQLRRLN